MIDRRYPRAVARCRAARSRSFELMSEANTAPPRYAARVSRKARCAAWWAEQWARLALRLITGRRGTW